MKTLFAAVVVFFSLFANATTYQIIDLGTLGGSLARARDINETGTIVGYATNPVKPSETRIFSIENGGQMVDLGIGVAEGINNTGDIVGWNSSSDHGFFWQNGTLIDLGGISGRRSLAFAINDYGLIAGRAYALSGANHACIWYGIPGVIDIDPSGTWSGAVDVNNGGLIVGTYNGADGKSRAFSWSTGSTMLDLGTLGGNTSSAFAVNDLGQVIGYSTTSPGEYRPFLWENGQMINLGVIGSPESPYPMDINNSGEIVGYFSYPGPSYDWCPWVWRDGTYTILPRLGDGWTAAEAINDSGVIVGWSTMPDGNSVHAVKWIPIPDPTFALTGSLALLDFIGDITNVPITVEVRKHGGATTTTTINVDSGGWFSINDVAIGDYDIAFKASHWLRDTLANISVYDNVTGLAVVLVNGDVDNDNDVDEADLAAFKGKKQVRPDADLNGDGRTNSQDMKIVRDNLGLVGDQ